MILGAISFATAILVSLMGQDAVVLAFASGALFGKGYGVWEERN